MSVTVKFEGLDELIRDFAALGDEGPQKLVEPATEAANMVMERARNKIHDVTGELARSLKVTKPTKRSATATRVIAKVGFAKGGAHGVPLELGHRLWFMGRKTNRDVEERPFLRPAADESKEEVVGIMADGMNKILEEWGD